ncbi:related to CYC8 General repressor of transcription [Rhynchosporium secalis]|uniref:Related to CYC8 General repressor of transcription n=1 Tax=Rhynchosporium secalis TaxID=38038 RepID=A0A1E1LUL3_RHYSE|nr:related to CYC8 General repressor of transcription [Rhynchosporium secalis]
MTVMCSAAVGGTCTRSARHHLRALAITGIRRRICVEDRSGSQTEHHCQYRHLNIPPPIDLTPTLAVTVTASLQITIAKMVYDWENKEDICYRMYIEEKKSLEDIMDFMKEEHKFAPSKRAFQTQFKRWDFPSKQNPAHKNAALVERVKQLWDCNTSQRDMLRTLNEEGYDIKERELMRVRAKNRWLLRVPNGMKTKKSSDQDVISQLQQALYPGEQMADAEANDEPLDDIGMPESRLPRGDSPPLSPEVMRKRQERLSKLQAESAERWASRKRRRRTRGWAGLPADPPGPPRFPSETTIDESKAFLSLDNRLYRDIRSRFQRICEETDIIKKTIAGPERWEAAKDRLVQESPHLQSVFWANEENQEAKKLALDVVCSDVTKRMRTLERRMTIAEAKNSLGVNPEESRQLRNAFYQVLKGDHFTSKLEAGEDHWKELKATWINGSSLLQNILAPGDADPQHQDKVKAMEVLCRDVMKRLRDDQTKRDPTRKKKFDSNFTVPTPDLNPFETNDFQSGPDEILIRAAAQAQSQIPIPNQALPQPRTKSRAQPRPNHAQAQQQPRQQVMIDHNEMQIDPSLLLAAANDPSLMNRGMQNQFTDPYADQQYAAQASQASFQPQPASFSFYFRLHPNSEVATQTRMWISTMSSTSLEELRQLATAKFPGTIVFTIEGVIKPPNGPEMLLPIDQDDELEAYLAAIGGVKPMFAVQLVSAWKNTGQM